MTERLEFNTPKGRFVSGSLTELVTKDRTGAPIPPEKQTREFGLAIPKTDPGLMPMLQQIGQHAKAGYAHQPHVAARIDQWFQTMQGFSMKISDGDKPNSKGLVNSNMAGCFVIWFKTSLEINTCGPDNVQIDPSLIKRGYYVDVAASCAVNGLTDHNAGIYMNPGWVRLLEYGDEIVGGMDAATAFGGQTAPPLAPAPAGNVAPGTPGGGLPGVQQGGAAPAPVTDAGGLPGSTTASPTETHPAHPGILGAGGLPGM